MGLQKRMFSAGSFTQSHHRHIYLTMNLTESISSYRNMGFNIKIVNHELTDSVCAWGVYVASFVVGCRSTTRATL